jgi:hypothetical protein
MTIELTMIVSERGARQTQVDPYTDTDEPDEQQQTQSSEPVVVTKPVRINAAAVRCYYARKDDKPGTRITFTDGGGFAVVEDYARCVQLIG